MIKTASGPTDFLGWMDSLSDPTRLRLLRLIERHELGVAELCDVIQLPQSTVSRHLKLLGDQGWVRCRRQGTTRLYQCVLDELDSTVRRLWLLVRQQTDGWAAVTQDQLRLAQRLEQRQSDSQAFFAGAAGQWDKLRIELYGQRFSDEALVALLPSHWIVADLGCGTGQFTTQLAAGVAQVIGVDHSAAMLKAARKRTANFRNVQLRRGDLEAVPIDDGSCDAAVLMLVLAHVPRPAAALAEATRILRPRGKVLVVDLLRHDREGFCRQMGQQCLGFETAALEKMLTQAGLVTPQCRPLAPEPLVKGPALMIATATRPGLARL